MNSKNFKLNIIQLIGSFVLFIGILGIFVSVSNLYQDWNTLLNVQNCYQGVDPSIASMCKDDFFKETGAVIGYNNYLPSASQKVAILFAPLMWVFGYIILSLVGVFVYSLGHHIVLHDVASIVEHKLRENHPSRFRPVNGPINEMFKKNAPATPKARK